MDNAGALRTRPGLLAETFDTFRRCGSGREECVVYWTSRLEDPDLVDEVVHPAHSAGPAGYEVKSEWVTSFFLRLRRDRLSVRLQAHTHPTVAFHSGTDDRYSLVPSEGFISLVIPHFALGDVSYTNAVLAVMGSDGNWMTRPIEDVLFV